MRPLRRLLGIAKRHASPSAEIGDQELLDRYVRQHDDQAFTTLMERHQGLVLGVCRRVLRNAADADDAFQAVFLILARKAASLHITDSLAGWLYTVAHRIAVRASRQRAKLAAREKDMKTVCSRPESPGDDVLEVLDEELARLPEKLRAPLILCYLERRTNEAAAAILQCPRTTVSWRLGKGLERLCDRMTRRGVVCSAGSLAASLTRASESVAVSPRLILDTFRGVLAEMAPANEAASVLSDRARAWAAELGRELAIRRLARWTGALVAVLFIAAFLWSAHAWLARPATEVPPTKAPVLKVADGFPFVQFLPDGTVLTAGAKTNPTIWSPDSNKLVELANAGVKTGVNAFALSPDREKLAIVRSDWSIAVVRLTNKDEIPFAAANSPCLGLAWSTDSCFLATIGGMFASEVMIWNAAEGLPVCRFDGGLPICFVPNSENLLVTINDALILKNWRTGDVVRTAASKVTRKVPLACASPEGPRMAALIDENTICLFNPSNKQQAESLQAPRGTIHCLQFLPSGKWLIAGGWLDNEQGLYVWDVDLKTPLSIKTVPFEVCSMSLSDDGQRIALGCRDATVRILKIRELSDSAP